MIKKNYLVRSHRSPILVRAHVRQKSEAGLKEIVKKALKTLMASLVFIPAAHGFTIKNPTAYAQKAEQVAKSAYDVDVNVDAKEKKIGGLQGVVFKINSPDGSHATVQFIGTESETFHHLDVHSGTSNSREFNSFLKDWTGVMGEQIEKQMKDMEKNTRKYMKDTEKNALNKMNEEWEKTKSVEKEFDQQKKNFDQETNRMKDDFDQEANRMKDNFDQQQKHMNKMMDDF